MKTKVINVVKNVLNKIASVYKKGASFLQTFFNKNLLIIVAVMVTIFSLLARYFVILYPSQDVAGIIFSWIRNIQKVGFKNFYTINADYSYFLLFIYAVISLFPMGKEITIGKYSFPQIWMVSVKSINYLNDILLAVAIALILYHITKNKTKAVIAYCILMCLPVQLADSAIWGNCDSLYAMLFAFILLAILKHKDGIVWLLFGFTLGTKMQAVFIFPFLVYLVLSGRLKFYKIYYAVIGLVITFLPTWLCGSGFVKPFTYFGTQVNRFSSLTLGCANMWHLFGLNSAYIDNISKGTTLIGLLLIGFFLAILLIEKIDLNDENLIKVGIFMISIVPFFLPHMHERYFFFLDVGVVLYALLSKKKKDLGLIILMQVSSGIAYYHYLSGRYFIHAWGEDSVHIAAFINLFVLGYIFVEILNFKKITQEPNIKLVEINE